MLMPPKKEIKTKKVMDSLGKNYLVKEISAEDKFNVIRIIGADAENTSYLTLCCVLSAIAEIDGVPVPQAHSMNDFYQIFDNVKETGLALVAETLKSFEILH